MIIVFAIVGLILGATIGDAVGAMAGIALGVAIGTLLTLRSRVAELQSQVDRLEQRHNDDPRQIAPDSPRQTSTATSMAAEPMARTAPAASIAKTTDGSPLAYQAAPSPPPYQAIFPEPTSPAGVSAQPSARRHKQPDYPPLLKWVREYFMGGNLVVRAGIIVLFFGVAFLLKFAADRNMMPIELRLAGVALGGAALLVIGWRLRLSQRAYALALQGGGVGLLYLTVFAALRLYHLLPPTFTFAMLVAVAGLSAFLAIGQNSLALAALGATGGFLAPVLASTGEGNHVVLFTYYALLNAGIVAIAWFKAWRALNVLAFVFTFGIGTAWGVLRYSPRDFATTEPFLVLFFAMFLAVAVLFALRRAPQPGDYVDGTLVFGTPVVVMLLQSALVRDRPYAMAFSALALSTVYLLLAAWVWRLRREELRLLAAAFLALGVAFLTLAVPLALDGHWTAATWALEGAAILWIGMRQDRKLAIAAGALLQVGASVSFLVRHDVSVDALPLLNSGFFGALFIAVGGLATARVMHAHGRREAQEFDLLTAVPVYWALLWWFVAGFGEIGKFVTRQEIWPAMLAFTTVTALGCAALSRWTDWRAFRPPVLLLLPVMVLSALVSVFNHPLAGGGLLAWPAALVAWFWLLRWRYRQGYSPLDVGIHVASLWLVVALVTLEFAWQAQDASIGAADWHRVMWLLPAAAALALIVAGARRQHWPVSAYADAYVRIGAAGLALYLWFWSLVANGSDGAALPLPYLPVANPIELAQAFALAAVTSWLLHMRHAAPADWKVAEVLPALWPALAVAVFAFLTTILLRILHHYVGVPYEIVALAQSTMVQASLSIFWGVIALTAMIAGARGGWRVVWFAGALLLGLVLAKMFLVDLSRTGTVARIVSFIGVGVLMLVIGRFSPVPPAIDVSKPAPGPAGAAS